MLRTIVAPTRSARSIGRSARSSGRSIGRSNGARSLIPLATQRHGSRTHSTGSSARDASTVGARFLATSTGTGTGGASAVEYELDLITMKKTPKPQNPRTLTHNLINFKVVNSNVDPAIITAAITKINTAFPPDITSFVLRNTLELTEFLRFIQTSYDFKIKSFDQLTTVELLNCLYIFKDYYLKNKIPSINKYNFVNYNVMFGDCLKLLKLHPDCPQVLNEVYLINHYGMDLLSKDFGNYLQEMDSLTKEFDFSRLSLAEIVASIDMIIRDFDNLVPAKYDDNFFRLLVQINKYKNLKSVLQGFSGLPVDLLGLIQSQKFRDIVATIKEPFELNKSDLFLLKYVLEDLNLTVCQIITRLYQLNDQQFKPIYETLVNLTSNGLLGIYDKPLQFSLTKFKISKDLKQNFDFSMVFKYNLYDFVDELKILKAMDVDLSDQSCLEAFDELTLANDKLVERFNSLFVELSGFFEILPWDSTDCLNHLITNKNWKDWCQEIASSKMPLMLIDYSNLSDYGYKAIEISTELANVLPQMAQFSVDNNVSMSVLSLDYLLALFNDGGLKKLYLNHGGTVYLNNLQDLITDFNHLKYNLVNYDLSSIKHQEGVPFSQFNHFQLVKHFGYYLELITNPLILDNLLELYTNTKPDIVATMVNELPKYSYELEIFRTDELKKNYGVCDFGEVVFLLDKRIKEILSNLNSNPTSRLNFNNVESFLMLQRILGDIHRHLTSEDQFHVSQLDGLIKYTQVPDHFQLNNYVNDLEYLRHHLNKPFRDCSIDEVLVKLEELLEASTLVLDKNLVKLSIKLQQLFRLNGGDTSVLDTVIHSQAEFERLEARLGPKEFLYDLGIQNYAQELGVVRDLAGASFESLSSDQVLAFLDECRGKGHSYTELYHKLQALFMINNDLTGILDKLVEESDLEASETGTETSTSTGQGQTRTGQVIDEMNGKFKYTQIPDYINIHDFTNELEILLVELGTERFEIYTDFEILDHLDRRIEEVLNISSLTRDTDDNDALIDYNNIDNFCKLNSRLKELFAINGHNTQVLDSVLNSERVFKQFEEKKLAPSSSCPGPYRQLPDDFRLQEFIPEITQLKLQLNSEFRFVPSHTVLETVQEMALNERKFNLDKRQNLTKLLKNLTILFGYNGHETSVLDNILLNHEAIQNLKPSTKNEYQRFLEKHLTLLQSLFAATGWQKYDLVDFADLTPEEFVSKVDKFVEDVKVNNKYQYPSTMAFASDLKHIYGVDPLNLPILLALTKSNKTSKEIEDLRDEMGKFMEKLAKNRDLYGKEENEYKERVEVPVERFSMDEFRPKVDEGRDEARDTSQASGQSGISSGIQYNLTVKDIKEQMNESDDLFFRNQLFHALEDHPNSQEMEEIMALTPEKIRQTYTKQPEILSYLEKINKEKKHKEEEKFRQTKAYEWSKMKSSSNRSLESRNFFDPLPNPTSLHNARYLLLTMDGEKIVSKTNPLGSKPFEDIVDVLNKFKEAELNKFVKNINKLQTKDWKLIGGNSSNFGQYLVFVKVKDEESGLFRKLKSVLAMTGATFMVLIGLNYWLDEPQGQKQTQQEKQTQPAPEPVPEPVPAAPVPVPDSEPVPVATSPKPKGWFWR